MAALTLFRQVFLAALLAGLCAGVAGWGVRQVIVVPLILQAEVFERATDDTGANAGHQHDGEEAWRPADGAERMFLTLVTDILAAIAFALLLASVIQMSGVSVDPWSGIAWGIGGYVAVCLVPSIYLPPELPGMDSGALPARQAWWGFAVAATAAGLLLARFAPRPAWYVAAFLLIAAPHFVGTPTGHVDGQGDGPPADLIRRFVAMVLIANAIFWLVLGLATGFFQRRMVAAGGAGSPC